MAYRKLLLSEDFDGDGFAVIDGGTGEISIGAGKVTTSKVADEAIAPEKLEGGTASPGNSKVYGTDASGNLGFYDNGGGGGASPDNYSLLQEDEAKLHICYTGDEPTFSELTPGTFEIEAPAGTVLKNAVFIFTNVSLSGTTLTLKIVSVDGRSTYFSFELYRHDIHQQVPTQMQGILPTQDGTTLPGTVTAVFNGLNYNSLRMHINFNNTIIPE